jgi:tripartite ATP-independent transporter DctP family solute receptor
MKIFQSNLVALLAAALLAGGAAPVSAQIQERQVRFSIGPAEDHPEADGVREFARLVDQKSGGKIKVKGYFNAVLGADAQAIQALRSGTLEMTAPSSSPLVGLVKEFGVLDFPFLLNTNEEADALLDGPFGEHLLSKLRDKDLVGLAFWDNGFRNMTNSRRPITTAEDIKGVKLRVMQNPVYMETFSSLGANAVPMSFSEVFTALETKAIDGQENPFTTIVTAKLYEVQKYLTTSRHSYTPFVVLVSRKTWDGMSKQEQDILKTSAREAATVQRRINRKLDAEKLEQLKKVGMQVVDFSPAERSKLQAMTRPVHERFSKELGRDTLDLLQSEMTRIRSGKK